MISHLSAPIQSKLDKGKGHLYLETTKSQLLHISPPKDKPYIPTEIYKDCRHRISELRQSLSLSTSTTHGWHT